MKKVGFVSVILSPLLLLIVSPAFAENIYTTGDSTAEVHVQTNSSGSNSNNSSSNVHTHIEVETNGEKKVLDEDGPGNYSVESHSSGGTTSVTVTQNHDNVDNDNDNDNDNATKSADKKDESKEDNNAKETPKTPFALVVSLFKDMGGFILRIVRNL